MDVLFIDQNDGWTTGQNGIYYITHNGGESWEYTDIGYEETIHNIDFVNETTGWMIVDYEMIIRSEDGGYTWEEQTLPDEGTAYALDFIDENYGWAVGNGIFHTKTGGTVGEKENKSSNKDYFSIFPNPCNESISIQLNGNTQELISVDMLNINGQIVKSVDNLEISGGLSINLGELTEGLYLIKVRTDHQVFSEKVLKQ
jgi:hypothetical protein